MFNMKNVQLRYNYNLLVKTLCVSHIVLNLFDAAITIGVIKNGIGYERNAIISKIIDIFSLYPAMAIKMAVAILVIYFIYKESKNPVLKPFLGVVSSRLSILMGLIIVNIIYMFVMINNIYVLIS